NSLRKRRYRVTKQFIAECYRLGVSFSAESASLNPNRLQVTVSLAGISVLEPRNQLSGRFGARALWKAGQKFVRNCQRLLVIMQHLGKQTGLIKQAVFMHGILFLRDLILLERLL